jgi:hypothetical protein
MGCRGEVMDANTKLSPNFVYYEFWSNNFGKPKVEPPLAFFNDIKHIAEQLQIVRDILKVPIKITSGYRTPEWNASKSVEGAPGSLHLFGRAADSIAIGVPVKKYFAYICRYTDLNHLGQYITAEFVHAGIIDNFIVFKY